MPQYIETQIPAPGVDVHASPATTQGTGTYQVGDAPKTLGQKAQEAAQQQRTRISAGQKQKIKTYAPGQDPSIKGRTSFSQEAGD